MRQTVAGRRLTARQIVARARRMMESGQGGWNNQCQRFVRTMFGAPGGAPTALSAWQQADFRHTGGTPPAGAAVYWGGGAGHVAISAGNGWVYSTDILRPGKVDLVPINMITKRWGKPLLGWSEDNNGYRITRFNAPAVNGPREVGGYKGGGGQFDQPKRLAQDFGFAAEFYNSSPELKALIKKAVKNQWTPDMFSARLRGTDWWKEHTAAQRKWIMETTGDPAQAKQDIKSKVGDIRQMANQLGVVAPDRLRKMAETALKWGWDDQRLRNALANEFDYKPGAALRGAAGQAVGDLKQQAAAYLVPLSNQRIDNWTTQVLRGDATVDDFTEMLKQQAKSLFPDKAIHAAIDRGETVDQYLDPYRQIAAQTLGVNPDSVNWLQDKWRGALWADRDKATDPRQIKNLADWTSMIKTDKRFGYDTSQNARNDAAQFITRLEQLFGRAG